MTNFEDITAKCTRICSAFYADEMVLRNTLFDEGIDPDGQATPKNRDIIRLAIVLVLGFVNSSHSENGVSVSIDRDAVEDSIKYWCEEVDLDVSEFLNDIVVISDGSSLC